MARSSSSRARGAAAASAPEGPPAAIPLAVTRPRQSEAPAPDREKTSRLASLDVAGRLEMLREAFERRSRHDAGAQRSSPFVQVSQLARKLALHQRKMVKALVGLVV